MKNKFYISFGIFALAILFLVGCSKLKDANNPISEDVPSHPQGFVDTNSTDFHGALIVKNKWDLTECRRCHSADLSGGIAGVSCRKCHTLSEVHDKYILDTTKFGFHANILSVVENWNLAKCKSCHGINLDGPTADKSCRKCHTYVKVHDSHILDTAGTKFHGKLISTDLSWNMAQCRSCHGADYKGGKVSKSCYRCHNATYLHQSGIATQTSPDFHASVLAANSWNFTVCRKCHGTDYKGGVVGKSCMNCHNSTYLHQSGIQTQGSSEFHGTLIVNNSWDLSKCQQCHGTDFTGGKVNKTCMNCHTQTYLHRTGILNPSSTEFHGALINANNWDLTKCKKCHGTDYLGGRVNKSCMNCHTTTYLHTSGIKNPSSPEFHGKLISGRENWDITKCQKCHGTDYRGGKVNKSCTTCHTGIEGPASCNVCHGDPNDPDKIAPPRALNGSTSVSYRGVGAHSTHLLSPVNANITACSECHIVPNTFSQSGHIDATAGAEIIFGAMAKLQTNLSTTYNYNPAFKTVKPSPVYNTDGTCANVYCHGAFKYGNENNVVSWTATSVKCGSCHGDGADNPLPTNPNHPQNQNCQWCHADVISAVAGSTYTFNNRLKHINGKLNIGADERPF